MSPSSSGVNPESLAADKLSRRDLAALLAVVTAATEITDDVDRVLRSSGAGLSPKEWDTLAVAHAIGPCRPSEMLRRLALTRRPQTLSSILDRLETRGLLARSPLDSGGRAVLVRTTGEGDALVERLFPVLSGRVVGPFASHFSDDELAALLDFMQRLNGQRHLGAPRTEE